MIPLPLPLGAAGVRPSGSGRWTWTTASLPCPVLCCDLLVGFASVCVGFDHNYRASSPLYFHSIHLPNKFYKMDDQPFPKMYVSCFRIFVAKNL